jgi:hypothetical protein
MRFKYFGLFIVFVLLPLSACGNGEKKRVDILEEAYAVEAGDGRYVSDFFDLSVEKPESWYVLSSEELNKIMQVGVDVLAGEDENTRRALDASSVNTVPLFGFFQYKPETPVEFNNNLLAIAENVRLAPGVKTGADYFFHARKMMQNSGLEIRFAEEYGVRDIGGREFASMDSVMTFGDASVGQTIYVRREGDYFLLFTESYKPGSNRDEVAAILDSIQIDW